MGSIEIHVNNMSEAERTYYASAFARPKSEQKMAELWLALVELGCLSADALHDDVLRLQKASGK